MLKKSKAIPNAEKRVRFAPGTADNEYKGTSVRIMSTEIVDDHLVYVVKHRGEWWTIKRRYSEFYDNYQALIGESVVAQLELPLFPQKRWFQIRRWLDKFNEEYSQQRTSQLEDYLKSLFSMKILRRRSKVFRRFFEFRDGSGEFRRSVADTSNEDDDAVSGIQGEVLKQDLEQKRGQEKIDGNDGYEDWSKHASSPWNPASADDIDEDDGECGVHEGTKDGDIKLSSRKGGTLISYLKEIEITPLVILLAMVAFGILTHYKRDV